MISQEDCASITLRSLRVQGFAFCLLGLCMWKSPCCTYYSALLIRCEIKGDFEELKKPIHYVLWSGNASIKAQQLTHAFKEDINPTFKPFPVRRTPHPRCSKNHPNEVHETAEVNQKRPSIFTTPQTASSSAHQHALAAKRYFVLPALSRAQLAPREAGSDLVCARASNASCERHRCRAIIKTHQYTHFANPQKDSPDNRTKSTGLGKR